MITSYICTLLRSEDLEPLRMTKPTIPLGLVFSRTGPYAMMAQEMEKSALMAVEEVNQSDAFDFTFAARLRDPGGIVAAYHAACDDLIREDHVEHIVGCYTSCLLYTSPSPRDGLLSRMPS